MSRGVAAAAGLAAILAAPPALAGCPAVDDPLGWPRTYQSPSNLGVEASAVAVNAAGHVFLAGTAQGTNPAPYSDWRIESRDGYGVIGWTATFNGSGSGTDVANGIAVSGAGQTVVAGTHDGIWVVRAYDGTGAPAWSATMTGVRAGDTAAAAQAVGVDAGGDAWVAGTVTSGATGNDWLLVRYSPAGAVLWTRTLDLGGDDRALAIGVAGGGTGIVVGVSQLGGAGQALEVRAFDAGGNLVWQDTLAGTDDAALAAAADAAGGAAVAGTTGSGGLSRGLLRRYGADGTLAWSVTAGDVPSQARGAALFADGRIAVAGTANFGTGSRWTVSEFDPAGSLVWSRSDGDPTVTFSRADAAAVDAGGRLYACGATVAAGNALWFARKMADVPCLAATISATPATPADGAVLGATVTALLSVTNTGSATAWALGPALVTAWSGSATFLSPTGGGGVLPARLPPGASAALTFSFTVIGAGIAVLTPSCPFTETVTGARLDLAPPPTVTVLTSTLARLDGHLLTVSPGSADGGAVPGRLVTITELVANPGGAPLTGVSCALAVSGGTPFLAAPAAAGATEVAAVPAGGSTTFSWTATVLGTGTVTLLAAPVGSDAGGHVYFDTGFATLVTGGPAGLGAALVASPNPALGAPALAVVLAVADPGGASATLTQVSLWPSAGAGVVSLAAAPGGLPSPASPRLVPAGAQAAFTWTYQPAASGTVTFTASVTAVTAGSTLAGASGGSATLVASAVVSVAVTSLHDALRTNLPPPGTIQVRRGIVNLVQGTSAEVLVRGTAGGGTADLFLFSRAGLELGRIGDGPVVLDADGVGAAAFDGRIGGRALATGLYWVVSRGAVNGRDRVMVVNGQ